MENNGDPPREVIGVRRATVLAALTPDVASTTVLKRAAALASAIGAELVVVHVVEPGSGGVSPAVAFAERAAWLREVASTEPASTRGGRVHSVVVAGPTAAEGILRVARERRAEVVVVGRRRVDVSEDLGGRRTAELVAQAARCSVLVVDLEAGSA